MKRLLTMVVLAVGVACGTTGGPAKYCYPDGTQVFRYQGQACSCVDGGTGLTMCSVYGDHSGTCTPCAGDGGLQLPPDSGRPDSGNPDGGP